MPMAKAGGYAYPAEAAAPSPMMQMNAAAAAPAMMRADSYVDYDEEEKRNVDVDEAIVKVGEAEGVFSECRGLQIERDPSFPIRVTLQYYKATSTGAINDEVMASIANQIRDARKVPTIDLSCIYLCMGVCAHSCSHLGRRLHWLAGIGAALGSANGAPRSHTACARPLAPAYACARLVAGLVADVQVTSAAVDRGTGQGPPVLDGQVP